MNEFTTTERITTAADHVGSGVATLVSAPESSLPSTTKWANLHVCLVTPYPVRDGQVGGGVEAASLRLANALIADGKTRVSIVAPAPVTRFEQRGPIDIHWTAAKLSFLPGILTYWTTERQALQAAARRVNADVVHFQAIAGWGLGFRGPRVFQMHGVPEEAVMLTERKSRYLSRLVHLMVERPARKSFKSAAVVGEHMKARFGPQFGGPVILAENTVPDAYFTTLRTPVAGRVLFGGIVSHRKNTMGVLQALKGVLREIPHASLHVAGETTSFPTYSESCKAFVNDNAMSANVTFLGGIGIDQMRSELADAEVLVLPSFNESAPIIICEALAMGVPVITSRRDGMPFMVDDSVTGYLVEPDDTDAIRRHLVELLGDRARNDAMGAAGKAVASRRFTEQALAATMKKCYEEALMGDVAGTAMRAVSGPGNSGGIADVRRLAARMDRWQLSKSSTAVRLSKLIQFSFEKVLYRLGIHGATTLGRAVCRQFGNDAAVVTNGTGASFSFPAWDSYYGHYLYSGLDYEPEISLLLAAHSANAKAAFLDCGANYGYWSALAASVLGGQVVAVELSPDIMTNLEANATLSSNAITVVNAAIWNIDGVPMNINRDGPNQGHSAEVASSGAEVVSRSIDSLVTEYSLDPRDLLIKIDCEGAEVNAVDGAIESARRGAAFILEEHGSDAECKISRHLFGLGWNVAMFDDTTRTWSKVTSISAIEAMKTDRVRGYNILAWAADLQAPLQVLFTK